MTLLYKNTKTGVIWTLEELVNKHRTTWKRELKKEIPFWTKLKTQYFDTILIEVSDAFDECQSLKEWEFYKDTDEPFNYQILIGQFLK